MTEHDTTAPDVYVHFYGGHGEGVVTASLSPKSGHRLYRAVRPGEITLTKGKMKKTTGVMNMSKSTSRDVATKAKSRKIAVKLTEDEWLAVVEAVSEWGFLTRSESEQNDGTTLEDMDERGKKLVDLASTIGIQARKL